VSRLLVTASVVPSSQILVTLMKEALSSCEMSVLTRATRRNIPEDTILNRGSGRGILYVLLLRCTWNIMKLSFRKFGVPVGTRTVHLPNVSLWCQYSATALVTGRPIIIKQSNGKDRQFIIIVILFLTTNNYTIQ
jgi:hypothetical protein